MLLVFLLSSIRKNQGLLIYTLDDPYIHMAIAKHFSQDGVWGVTKYGFSSSSSSLFWTLLLSLIYLLSGAKEVAPLILNIISGTIAIVLLYLFLKRYKIQPFYTFICLLAAMLFTSLPSLIFSGMEHVFYAVLTMLAAYLAASVISDKHSAFRTFLPLLILAPVLAMTRYEGLFLIFSIGIMLLLRRKFFYALSLGAAGILPLVIYGIISVSNGCHFLPNSVLLKGNPLSLFPLKGAIFQLGQFAYQNALWTPQLPFLIVVALIILIFKYSGQRAIWTHEGVLAIIFIVTAILHMLFSRTASFKYFHRYESYLLILGIFVTAIGVREYLPEKVSLKTFRIDKERMPVYIELLVLVVVFVSVLAPRGIKSLLRTPQATNNVYEQQYQMGLFLKRFYQGKSIAANDVGAINYLADIECLDLWGLATFQVAKLKREGEYNTQWIYDLAKQKDARVAMVYDYWYTRYGGLPSQWTKVGEWKILDNVVCAGDTVAIYAVDLSETENLLENLRVFSSHLPEDVVQTGQYTEYADMKVE